MNGKALGVEASTWSVAQIGARDHYSIARALLRTGVGVRLLTDLWSRPGGVIAAFAPRSLRGRYHHDLAGTQVQSQGFAAISSTLRTRLALTDAARYRAYLQQGGQFAAWAASQFSRRSMNPQRDIFLGYNTASLEVLEVLSTVGIPTVLSQIDAGPTNERTIQEEARRWQGWQPISGHVPPEFWDRLRKEWAAASVVLVNSDWTRSCLEGEGVPPDRIVVAPLAYETSEMPARTPRGRRLRVLWLGAINLLKGFPYFVAAASALGSERFSFTIVGGSQIDPNVLKGLLPGARFMGRVTRSEGGKIYAENDVFVFPTLSDGFGLTQLEAMAHGLPVIATENCGRVVRNGDNGLIVPPRSAEAILEALRRLQGDPALLERMSVQARATAPNYSLGVLGHRLQQIGSALLKGERRFAEADDSSSRSPQLLKP
jgi:hypothetical protein